MSNLSVNFLMDGYPNETSAEQALFSFLDRAPFRAVHISAGAKAEQGFSIAKKTRARYRDMLVFFRKLPNDVQHLHYPDVSAWFESLAPWSDGGKLILPITNEPGVVDLKRQNDWYAAAIERMGGAGIRVTAPALQTHNRFDAALLHDTWAALAKYGGFADLHYYFDPGDATYSFPIDHVHEAVAAYCKQKGIATRFAVTELGYLHKLDAYAGYRGGLGGGMNGATYAARLIEEARAHPDILYFIFGMGAQPPWLECDIGGDEDVIQPIAAYNKEKPTMPEYPPGTKAAQKRIHHTAGLKLRAQPSLSGTIVGVMPYQAEVTVYAEPVVKADNYFWQRVKWNGKDGWAANSVPNSLGRGVASFVDPAAMTFTLTRPVGCETVVTSRFGALRDYDGDGVKDDQHEGLDLAPAHADCRPPVLAGADGTVIRVSSSGDYGNCVVLEHAVGGDVYRTWYAHLDAAFVNVGDSVKRGSYLGIMGSTGNSTGRHLHLNLQWIGHGQSGFVIPDAVDPEPYLS